MTISREAIPPDAIPAEVRAVLDDLYRRGYSVVETRYYDALFGDVVIVLERDATQVRLARERHPWIIDVRARRRRWTRRESFGTAGDWFPPSFWRAFLEASTGPVEDVPFAVQARWLLEDLSRIEALGSLTKTQVAAMDDLQLVSDTA